MIHAWEGRLQPAAQQRHPIGAANLAGAAPKGQAATQHDCGRGAEGGGAEQADSIEGTENRCADAAASCNDMYSTRSKKPYGCKRSCAPHPPAGSPTVMALPASSLLARRCSA